MKGHLLDTHSALWWWTEPHKLSRVARELIQATEAPIYVSAISAFEIGYKWRRGQLDELGDPRIRYAASMADEGFRSLPVSDVHAMRAGTFEARHRDPFDRMIAAQSICEDLVLITKDREIAAFGCRTLW